MRLLAAEEMARLYNLAFPLKRSAREKRRSRDISVFRHHPYPALRRHPMGMTWDGAEAEGWAQMDLFVCYAVRLRAAGPGAALQRPLAFEIATAPAWRMRATAAGAPVSDSGSLAKCLAASPAQRIGHRARACRSGLSTRASTNSSHSVIGDGRPSWHRAKRPLPSSRTRADSCRSGQDVPHHGNAESRFALRGSRAPAGSRISKARPGARRGLVLAR